MSKQITASELATIIERLLNSPEACGELDESTSYSSFMTDLATVVADHCGGEVLNPASALDDTWYVGVHWNDSVPDGGGIWRDFDAEADFEPEAAAEDQVAA